MITGTSLEAFESIQVDLGHRQQIVLDALKTLQVANNKMISKFLGIPINQVTPRILELRGIKYVTFDHEGQCPWGGRNSMFWKCTKWGELAGELIDNPKVALLETLPYLVEYSTDHDRITCQYKARSTNGFYTTWIKVYPIGRILFGCDCYDFTNTKQNKEPCKHIIHLVELAKKNGHSDNTDYLKRFINGVEVDATPNK